jgi:hypothetical protein
MNKVSLVIACLALLVSTAGGAYAGASSLVGSKQIKDHSVQYVDLSKKAAAKLRGKRGPRGYQGINGLNGLQGPAGPAGLAGGFDPAKVQYVTGASVTIAPGDVNAAGASCPAGSKVVGGGFMWSYETSGLTVQGSGPNAAGSAWVAALYNGGTIDATVNAYAVCAAK